VLGESKVKNRLDTTVPGTAPGTADGGVQPDVTYDVPRFKDSTTVIAARLGDPGALLAPLGDGLQTFDTPSYMVQQLPATIRYEAFNPKRMPSCQGLITPPVTVTGLWEKTARWPGHQAVVRVIEFGTAQEAAVGLTAFSLEQGPEAEECSGFTRDINRTDATRARVTHQDPVLDVPAGIPYTSWVGPPPPGVTGFQSVTGVVARFDRALVLMAVASTGDVADPARISALLRDMGTRLQD
jgi:hypothetical protein